MEWMNQIGGMRKVNREELKKELEWITIGIGKDTFGISLEKKRIDKEKKKNYMEDERLERKCPSFFHWLSTEW